MKKLILALSFLFTASFIVFFLFIRPGDERQIRKNLISLAARVSKLGDENEFIALVNIQRIKTFFTQDCRISVGAPFAEIQGQNMLLSTLHQSRRMVNKIEVDFYDISVILEENSLTAKTTLTAKVTVPGLEGERWIREARELEMHWKKVGNQWKIAKIQLVPTFR